MYFWSFLIMCSVYFSVRQPFRSCKVCFSPRKTHAVDLRDICAMPRITPALLNFKYFVLGFHQSTRTLRLGEKMWAALRGQRGFCQKRVRLRCLQSAFITCHKIHLSPSSWPSSMSGWTLMASTQEMPWQDTRPPTAKVAMCGLLWSVWRAGLVTESKKANVELLALARKKPCGHLVLCWVRRLTCKFCFPQVSQVFSSPL